MTFSLVDVNVHFEPDLTLCERLRLITPHWPCYPGAFGVIIGDLNICEPEEGRFNAWNQMFTDCDAGLNLILPGKTLQPMVPNAHCLELTEHSFISLWHRHATSTAILMSLRTLVSIPSRVITQLCELSYRNRQIGATRSKVFRARCRNIPSSVPF